MVAEEYFEYIDVLASVLEYAPGSTPVRPFRPFAFVELGSGYGHWALAAHRALQQRAPRAQHHYLLVDVVASLRPAIDMLTRLNGLTTNTSNHSLHFHVGYVTEKSRGEKLGERDLKVAAHNMKTYGELWGTGQSNPADFQSGSMSLGDLFDLYRMPRCIDMVDIDIQSRKLPPTSHPQHPAPPNITLTSPHPTLPHPTYINPTQPHQTLHIPLRPNHLTPPEPTHTVSM